MDYSVTDILRAAKSGLGSECDVKIRNKSSGYYVIMWYIYLENEERYFGAAVGPNDDAMVEIEKTRSRYLKDYIEDSENG